MPFLFVFFCFDFDLVQNSELIPSSTGGFAELDGNLTGRIVNSEISDQVSCHAVLSPLTLHI